MPEDRSLSKPVEEVRTASSSADFDFDTSDLDLPSETAPAPSDAPAPAATPTDPPAASATPATPPTDPGPSASAAPASPPAATEFPAAAPVTPEPVPHSFKADGRELPIPGLTRTAAGDVVIPAGSLPHLQRHLADRTEVQRRETTYKHTIQQQQQALATKDQTRDALLQQFEALIATAADGSAEAVIQWAQQKARDFPAFRAQLDRAEVESEKQRIAEERAAFERERNRPLLEPQWRQAVAQHARSILSDRAEMAGMTLDDAMLDRLWAFKDHGLLIVADRDVPDAGIAKGETAVSLATLYQLLQTESVAHQRLTAARAEWERDQQTKAAQAVAAQKNAAQQIQPPVTAPATTGRTPTAPPTDRPRNADGTFAKTAADNHKTWEQDLREWNPLVD